jgi:hypothetical protein
VATPVAAPESGATGRVSVVSTVRRDGLTEARLLAEWRRSNTSPAGTSVGERPLGHSTSRRDSSRGSRRTLGDRRLRAGGDTSERLFQTNRDRLRSTIVVAGLVQRLGALPSGKRERVASPRAGCTSTGCLWMCGDQDTHLDIGARCFLEGGCVCWRRERDGGNIVSAIRCRLLDTVRVLTRP